MFAAFIENGTVTQVSKAASGQQLPVGWVLSATRVGIGWAYTNGEFLPPPAQVQAPTIPQEVSRFQAKEALRQAGLLDQADAAVAASGNATLQNAWANANTFKRTSPGINALAPAIGLDDAGLDALFIAAAGIVA